MPDGLRAAGWSITTMDERYGVGESQMVDDTRWIAESTRSGEVLITKDRNIAKRPFEAAAILQASARVFVITNANITGPEMLARLLVNETRIDASCSAPGPWVFGVYADRLGGIRLNA